MGMESGEGLLEVPMHLRHSGLTPKQYTVAVSRSDPERGARALAQVKAEMAGGHLAARSALDILFHQGIPIDPRTVEPDNR